MPKAIVFIMQLIIFSILFAFINNNLTSKKDSKFSITLDNFNSIQYIGGVFVGSDFQEMKTIFSTGTSLTWLTANSCTECRNITNKFESTTSSTYKSLSDDLAYDVLQII
jgi:hypothetical protein